MKKTLRILLPIILVASIFLGTAWYLMIYDRDFTRDMLLQAARYFDRQGHLSVAAWFYDTAYEQSGDNDAVAIELAHQHKADGNYTQAEAILARAIEDGGGPNLYIALCKLYVEQDKLLDAVKLLNGITNMETKAVLDQMRPAVPTASHEPGFYNQYISISVAAESGTLYVNAFGEYPSIQDAPYTEPITLVDGENTLYAVAVADNGLVSPLAVLGYTVGGVVEELQFADPAFESVIRQLLGVRDDAVLFTNDLWDITSFVMPSDVTNYSDLQYMPFLEELTIENGVSKNLTVLSSLSHLRKLHIVNTPVSTEEMHVISTLNKLEQLVLSDCGLSSVSGLENLINLEILDLSDNTIRNITSLSALVKLREINLQHNVITDLSILSNLPALAKLDISYNTLTDLSPLAGLPSITWLNAGHNQISSAVPTGTLVNLEYLDLSFNQINSIAELSELIQLKELNISNNAITDISVISKLNGIQNLVFSYNQVEELPEFSNDCALVTIDGSYNMIQSLKPLTGLKNLNTVSMDYNEKISSVECLANCPVLISVNVFGTKVKDVSSLTDQSIVVNFDPTI